MPKKTLIITSLIVALIALGATAFYITLRQGGEEVAKQEEVATIPEAPKKPVAQPREATTQLKEINQSITTESIDTSNWKTYRNEWANFEIKYPPELIPDPPGSGEFKFPEQDPSDPYTPFSFEASDVIPIPYINEKGEKDWKTVPDPCEVPPIIEGSIRKIVIGGVEFTRLEERFRFPNEINILYIGKKGKMCYRFWYLLHTEDLPNDPKGVIGKKYKTIFDKIVSTFRLLREK